MNEPHGIRVENAVKILNWIKTRGGVAVWRSVNLSNPGMSWTCPVNDEYGVAKPRPYGEAESTPSRVITSTDDIMVHTDVEVGRFKIHLRMSDNGLMLKLTDNSTLKVNKATRDAGPYAYHLFDYGTEEAVILAPDGNSMTLTQWAKESDTRPTFYECDICDHLHPQDFSGDCREDAPRFALDSLNLKYGENGWRTPE